MCGRFKRGSDKQRVAKVVKVTASLDETVFDKGDDLRPQGPQRRTSVRLAKCPPLMPADDSTDDHHGDYQGKSYQKPWYVFPLAGRHFSSPTSIF